VSCITIDGSMAVDKALVEDLASGRYNAILITPEKIFKDTTFRTIWDKSGWRELLMAVVLDEAHCVQQWASFRKHYSQLGVLRSKTSVPFLSCSATLSPQVITEIKAALHYRDDSKVFNEGNSRRNIYLEVRRHKVGRDGKLKHGLKFVLDGKKTLIYVDRKRTGLDILLFLRKINPDYQMRTFHRHFSDKYKSATIEMFMKGDIRLLICTDAAGMGLDIRDVER
ncbi:hypothetical protein EC991_010361, partial [Linnemannia zychae]